MAEEGMGLASGVAPVTRVVEVVEEITLSRSAARSPEKDKEADEEVEGDLSYEYVVKSADEDMDEGKEADDIVEKMADAEAEEGLSYDYIVKPAGEKMSEGDEVIEEVEEIFTYVVKDVDQDQQPDEGKLVVDAKQVLMCQYCKSELTDESEDARARHRDQCAKYHEYKAAADAEDKADDDADDISDSSDDDEADAEAEEDAEGDEHEEEENEEPMNEDVPTTETNHASSPIPSETSHEQQEHEEDTASEGDDDAQETKHSSPISSDTPHGHELRDEQQREDPQEPKSDYSARLRSRKTQESTPDGDTSSLPVDQDPPQLWDDHYRYFVDDLGKPKAKCLKCGKAYLRANTWRLKEHLAACDKPKDANKDPNDSTTDDEAPARRPKPTTTQEVSPSGSAASKRPRQTPQKQHGQKPKKMATPATPALGKRKKTAPPPTPRRPPAAKRIKTERKLAAAASASPSATSAKQKPQVVSGAQAKPDAVAAMEDHVMQFEAMDGTQKVRCKHCGSLVVFQRKMPSQALERHLADCKEYAHRQKQGLDLEALLAASNSNPDEAVTLLGHAILDKRPEVCAKKTNELDAYSTLVWLVGSVENASTLKSHYGRGAAVVHGPSSRFDWLVDQQLHSLDVPELLAQVATPVTLFVSPTADSRTSNAVKVDSQASAFYRQGYSMAFDAPPPVCELLTLPFAIDRGLGGQHCEASVVCGRTSHLDWQYHRMDAFCIQLRGETLWKIKKGAVRHPLRCVHPLELSTGHHDAGHATDLLTQMHEDAPDPEADEEGDLAPPQEDEDHSVYEAMTAAGSVVYVPTGTWFATESENDAVWLELRMGRANFVQWLLDSAKHMLSRSPKWRASVFMLSDPKSLRSHVGELIHEMQHSIASLTPADLLPEYLGMAATHSDAGAQHEWDLTHQHFTGSRHVRVLQSSHFRVNPLARLTSLDEVQPTGPPLAAPVSKSTKTGSLPKLRRNLKALAPVPARIYVLHLLGGEALFNASKLRVQFSCNAFQVALVEWIRGQSHRGSMPFTSLDVASALQKQMGKAVSQDDDAVKYMLRFLCFAGYLTLVKAT